MSILDYDEYKKVLKRYFLCNIDSIRINLTRYTPAEYIKEIETIKKIYTQISNGLNINIILDIPFPGTKSRIVFDGMDPIVNIKKDEEITITNNLKNINIDKKIIYVEKESSIYKAKKGNKLYIDDGKSSIIVKSNNNNLIKGNMNNTGELKYLKSIYIEQEFFELEKNEEKIKDIFKAIEIIEPKSICLSFLESKEQLINIKNFLSEKIKNKVNLVPKIETSKGIENLKDIFTECETIMLGRGDLGITDKIYNLGINQEKVINICNELNKNIIIATDILNSICDSDIINRAEILDLYYILKNKPSGIVASGQVSLDNSIIKFCEIINNMNKET